MGVRLLVRSCWASRSEDDAVYEFDQTRILIGRGRGADVRLPHRAVSVRHATIELSGGRYVVVDHGATNGTLVQDARIVPGRNKPLRDGDRIEIGGFSIVFRSGVAVTRATGAEHTASLARRLAREALDAPREELTAFVTVLNGPGEGRVVPLPTPPARMLLGRGEACDVVLDDADLSREHAEIDVGLGGVWIRDLGSKNGVFLGQRKVVERLLADRDELRFGATMLRFEDPAAEQVAALEGGEDERVDAPTWADVAPEPAPVEAEAGEGTDEASAVSSDASSDEEAPPDLVPKGSELAASSPKPGVAAADMLIYVLASVVFALSVLGLLWLLRSG